MHSLLLATVLATAAPDSNDGVLVARDWLTSDGQQMLALRPIANARRGTAWYFRRAGNTYRADSGYYTLTARRGAPVVRLHLCRAWQSIRQPDGTLRWALDPDYSFDDKQRYGVDLECSPDGDSIRFMVVKAFRIDRFGQESRVQVEQGPFHHFVFRDVVTMHPGDAPQTVQLFPPPGYVPRRRWDKRKPRTPSVLIADKSFLRQELLGVDADGQQALLSLGSEERWGFRTATFTWMLRLRDDDGNEWTELAAARGSCATHFGKLRDQDVLRLKLSLPRMYVANSKTSYQWTVADNSSQPLAPTAIWFHVPLDNGSMRTDGQTIYVDSFEALAPDGTRSPEPKPESSGLLNLFRSAALPAIGRLHVGATFRFQPLAAVKQHPVKRHQFQHLLRLIAQHHPPLQAARSGSQVESAPRPLFPARIHSLTNHRSATSGFSGTDRTR